MCLNVSLYVFNQFDLINHYNTIKTHKYIPTNINFLDAHKFIKINQSCMKNFMQKFATRNSPQKY